MKTQTIQTKYGIRILRMLFTFALALLPLFILLPLPVFAATITVDTLADESDGSCSDGDCSLRDAIAVASASDTINFDVTGTITLTLDYLTIDKDLTIEGPGAADLIVNGDDTWRVFWINEDVNAILSGITIADGKAQDGAGIFNRGGT
ncbi:MAG: CSLREA domain-containing protein, partial [Anaerolineae bacterium]